ncbi:dTDP-4-amino-4,6-dideoxygalactose transaminase [Devosia sp.]|uniref:dTDP-4-amino-4,6-dideoxygalactose transaminase n=1 Tax=Devosia sp. TaxID=1871048 RepID=UPI003BABA7D0
MVTPASAAQIPFCVPPRSPNEQRYIAEALEAGVRSGDGRFSALSRKLISGTSGGGAAFLTTSGTAALELATLIIGIGPGDEVIVPSFTFSSVANAIVLRGATPVFVDVEPRTLNLDPACFEAAITPQTRAVIAVHYAGVICDMDRILTIARRHGIAVIEDAAHAIGARDAAGRPAGSFGDFAAFSFHFTKNITCGEGGALIVNEAAALPKAEIAFEKGTNRTAFFKGAVDKYSWVDAGASFILSELNAAMLAGQLEDLSRINGDRLSLWAKYHAACSTMAERFAAPSVGVDYGHNAHMFQLILPTEAAQDDFIAFMRARSITTPFHYVPLHSSIAGRKFGRAQGSMAVTDSMWNRLVRLPLYPALGDDVYRVIESITEWSRQF